jgi:endonuclease/exonuclease/phosphatase family metal-dependent hydrolase
MESPGKEIKKLSHLGKAMRFAFRLLSLVVISCYFLSYASSHFNPGVFMFVSVLGLFFWPLFVLFLLSAVIMAFRKEWKWLIVFGIFFALSLPDFLSFFNFNSGSEKSTSGLGMVVMTHNTHLMGYYDGENAKKNRDAVLSEIQNVKPNILCLQECYWNTKGGDFLSEQSRNNILRDYSVHERTTHVLSDGGRFGLLIFTNYPVVSRGQVPFENEVNNFCIYVDVLVGSDTIRIYNAHLQSFRLKKKSLELFDEKIDMNEIQNESKPLLVQLYRSSLKRSKQVDVLAAHIESCRFKVILAGDFNDTPISYTYNRLTRILTDGFKEGGSGIGTTYKGPLFGLRIDYIMHSKGLSVRNYKTSDAGFSDHHPIIVEF